ncbi:MAG TPA: CHAD domain-containing protein [Terriglobales bacterium]|jgi:CHAD domain-containing protein|nr:CHAD domain-containing protein [Terriglobales bacterium]
MPLDQENTRLTFRKLCRQLAELASKPAPENIHRFRTSSRRAEVLVAELAQARTRNDKKLLKLLGRLRKKTGRVRDLDVEIAALRSLKIPQEPVRKSQLMRTLAEERGKREKKLVKALDKKTVSEVRKRLKRTAGTLEISKNTNPLAVAMQKVTELEFEQTAVSEETLHRFRVAGKRARYIAEMAGNNAEAARLVEQLNHMQDAIGDWHDWVQLAERAERLFGGAQDSALVAALRNVTRAKFRQAVNTLMETRATLVAKKPASVTTMGRRTSRERSAAAAAVA